MKITVGQLRELMKQGLDETKVSASPDYMKKEKVREELQGFIAGKVAAGEVADEDQLEQLIQNMVLSVRALKMIPLNVWKKLASDK